MENIRVQHTILQCFKAHKLTAYDLGEYPCHPFLGSSQYYTVSKIGEFRNEYMCGQVRRGLLSFYKEFVFGR